MLRAFIITQFQGATKAWDGPAYYSKYRFGRICTCIQLLNAVVKDAF